MDERPRPLVLSGIQPTGQLMIGNYLGAVKNWVELQATLERVYRALGFLPGEWRHQGDAGGRKPVTERELFHPLPAVPGALHHRRNAVETKDTRDVAASESAASDSDAECMTDCCMCCCCDTEEECSMEE